MRRLILIGFLIAACAPATAPSATRLAPSATVPPAATPARIEPTLTSIGLPAHTPSPTGAGSTTLPPATPGTAEPLNINRFTVTPAEIRPGETVTLEWDVSGQEAVIYRLNALGQLSEMYPVGVSGSLTFVTELEVRNSLSYMLFASSGGASASALVSVRVQCPDVYFFPNPRADCPGSRSSAGPAAMQTFERGRMFWFSWNRLIYILFSDGSYPRWTTAPDQWQEGMPESDPALEPPAAYHQPVRGFGFAWRDEANAYLKVRERLGWGTQPEQAYSAQFQCNSAPKYITCYLESPAGEIIVLEPEGSGWRVLEGP